MNEKSEAEQLLAAIETVDEIIVQAEGIEDALRQIVGGFLDIFGCDRAFLRFLKPVSRGALIEPVAYTRRAETEAEARALVFEEDEFMRSAIATAHDCDEVFTCGPNSHAIAPGSLLCTRQGVRSLMIATVQPRLGPWVRKTASGGVTLGSSRGCGGVWVCAWGTP